MSRRSRQSPVEDQLCAGAGAPDPPRPCPHPHPHHQNKCTENKPKIKIRGKQNIKTYGKQTKNVTENKILKHAENKKKKKNGKKKNLQIFD